MQEFNVGYVRLVIREIAYELQDLGFQLPELAFPPQTGVLAHSDGKLLRSAFQLHADREESVGYVAQVESSLPFFNQTQVSSAQYSRR